MVIDRMNLIGLDAAFANTGIVLGGYDMKSGAIIVDELRLVTTAADKANKKVVRKNSDDLRRAKEIIEGIERAIADHKPSFVMVEVPTGTQSARSAWSLGIAVGVIAGIKRPLIQVTPKEVKDVTGEKFPDKEQMIAWAHRNWPAANWPMRGGRIVASQAEHMADACAVIAAGCKTEEFKRSLAMLQILR